MSDCLGGYSFYEENPPVNAHYFDDLINTIQNKQRQFIDRVIKSSYWHRKGDKMKFDAVVGNPPYQLQGGSGGSNDSPIYQFFANTINALSPTYSSLVIPARWFAAGRENLLSDFRTNMLNNDSLEKLVTYSSSHDLFPNVEIKGGICYYLINNNYTGNCEYTLIQDGEVNTSSRKLNDFDVLIREPVLAEIIKKVMIITDIDNVVSKIISNDTPFGISSNPKTSKKNPMKVYTSTASNHNTLLFHIEKLKRKEEFVDRTLIIKNIWAIDKHKVFIPGAGGSGNDSVVLGRPEYAPMNSVCSQSYLFAAFDSETEAKNFMTYLKTKFLRVLVSAVKISQSAPNRVYRFVPLQDFTASSDIDWTKSIAEIDKMLYQKYNFTDEEITYIEKKIRLIN